MPDRWLADKLFPNLPRDMRRRKAKMLILGVVLAFLAAGIIGAGLYALNASGRLGS